MVTVMVISKLKEKVCKYCSNKFIPIKSLQIACGYKCAIKLSEKASKIKREKISKSKGNPYKSSGVTRKLTRLQLNKNNLKWQLKTTQRVFNRMIVLEEFLWFKKRGESRPVLAVGKL